VVDYLIKQNEGDHEESYSEEEILVLEEEYQGERDIVSQTQEVEGPIMRVLIDALDRVFETHFPPPLEPSLG